MNETVRATSESTGNGGQGITLPPNLELGHYRLLRRIGQGGFGITYLAEHMLSHEQVVIKENLPTLYAYRDNSTLHVHSLDNEETSENYTHALKRFVNEARTLAHLHHPNIVRVHEAFEALGTAYYVMPYIRGKELHKAAPAVVDEAWLLPILKTVLGALSYLHAKNLLHRDLKPGNILLQEDGTPILIDFGTARALQTEHSATMIGTPGYTPIEQITPHGRCGSWTDLYALGATCYRLITGTLPPGSFERMDEEDPYIPLAGRAELRGRFRLSVLQSIDKALAARTKQRWQSAEEWSQALEQQQQVLLTPAEQSSGSGKRLLPILLGCAACLLLICGWGVYALIEKEQENEQLRAAVAQAELDRMEQALAEHEARAKAELAAKEKRLEEETLRLAREEAERQASAYMLSVQNAHADTTLAKAKDIPAPANEQILRTLQQLAANGNHQAEFVLSILYAHGVDMPQDEKQALTLLRKAAEGGYALAQAVLGRRYNDGLGVPKDDAEAAEWYRKAALQGLAVAQNNLGNSYKKGSGLPKDEEQAVKWFRLAAEQGFAVALDNLGNCYLNGTGVPKDEAEAVKLFRLAAEQKLAWAQTDLGWCYLNGKGVTKNAEEAVRLFRLAAEQDDSGAQYLLGTCHQHGTGVPKDEEEAVKWYRLAARQELPEAQHALGLCYEKGKGVLQDEAEAVKWYRLAANQQLASAQFALGLFYEKGSGVPKDEEEAVKWYKLAAEQDYTAAQVNLGCCYEVGTGVPKDEEEAVRFFRLAAEKGNSTALANLGLCYHNGRGVNQDSKKAFECFRKAAEQGYANAQHFLAICYEEGIGVKKDRAEAKKWHKKAADQGHEGAKDALKRFKK